MQESNEQIMAADVGEVYRAPISAMALRLYAAVRASERVISIDIGPTGPSIHLDWGALEELAESVGIAPTIRLHDHGSFVMEHASIQSEAVRWTACRPVKS